MLKLNCINEIILIQAHRYLYCHQVYVTGLYNTASCKTMLMHVFFADCTLLFPPLASAAQNGNARVQPIMLKKLSGTNKIISVASSWASSHCQCKAVLNEATYTHTYSCPPLINFKLKMVSNFCHNNCATVHVLHMYYCP